jgi:hypothetical protein
MGLGAFLKAKAPKMKGRPMPKRIAPLTVTSVRTIKPGKKPQKLFDEGGLFLLVTPSGLGAGKGSVSCSPCASQSTKKSFSTTLYRGHRKLRLDRSLCGNRGNNFSKNHYPQSKDDKNISHR